MKAEQEIFRKIRAYVTGDLSLSELEDWISDREPYWASLPKSSPARHLAGSTMLAIYEYGEGHREEPSVREIARQELQRLAPQPA